MVGVEDVSNKIQVNLVNRNKDLQIYYPGNDAHYFIPNISKYLDNTWRDLYPTDKQFTGTLSPPATSNTPVTSTPVNTNDMKIRWRATRDGTYYLYVNGREISKETNFELKGEDLYVFHPRSGLTFVLKNFVNRCDNVTRKGYLVRNKR